MIAGVAFGPPESGGPIKRGLTDVHKPAVATSHDAH
jgi:hypothetical protein